MEILVLDKLERAAFEELQQAFKFDQTFNGTDLRIDRDEKLREANVIIVRSATQVDKDLLDRAPNLEIVARAGNGIDNVDKAECEKRGISVINTPTANANAAAELTIGLMLCLARKIPTAVMQMRAKVWAKKDLVGEELEGQILGVIGFGTIGRLVSKKALALGMHVLATDINTNPLPMDGVGLVDLDTLLAQSKFVTLHVTLNRETGAIINDATLAKMLPGAYLINTSRGQAVDETAVRRACESGRLGGVALDVFAEEPYQGELASTRFAYLTPHLGASTKEAQEDRIPRELILKIRNEVDARRLMGRLRITDGLHIATPRHVLVTPALGAPTAALAGGGHGLHRNGSRRSIPR